MKRLLFFLISVFISFSAVSSNSTEEMTYRHLIRDNSVFSLDMDKQGVLWIGSENGLIRYDSKNFKYYRFEPRDSFSLLDNSVRAVMVDSKNRLWLGTRNGLNLYEREKDRFLPVIKASSESSSIQNYFITAIQEGPGGMLWIGTETSGLIRLNPETHEYLILNVNSTPLSLLSNEIEQLSFDQNGVLWIASHQGLDMLDIHTGEIYHYYNKEQSSQSLPSNMLSTVLADTRGNIWSSSFDGYFSKLERDESFHNYKFEDVVTSLFQINEEEIILGTKAGELLSVSIDSGLIHPVDVKKTGGTYDFGAIRHIFSDKWNNLWVGGEGGLFVHYALGQQFHTFLGELPDEAMISPRDVWVDKKNRLWILSDLDIFIMAGEETYSLNSFVRTGNTDELEHPYTIYEDSFGLIWIGTYSKGLFRFDPETGELTNYAHSPDNNNSLPHNTIWAITEDYNHNLWIGSWGGGLIYFDRKRGQFREYLSESERQGVNIKKIISLHTDREGILWIGTDGGGLVRFNPLVNRFYKYSYQREDPNSFADNSVLCIMEDSQGRLWLGTDGGGLLKMDKKNNRFEVFNHNHGLSNSSVKSIQEDRNGKLWLSTNGGGIFSFDPEGMTFAQYTTEDGISSNRFYNGAGAVDSSGYIYFSSKSGLTYFNPSQMKEDYHQPELLINSVRINNTDVRCSNLSRVDIHNENPFITLKPYEKFIEIDFSAVQYSHADRNNYRYRILGLNEEWVDLGRKSNLSLMNLPKGDFRLELQCSNMDGVWCREGKLIELNVLPHFYETSWFVMMVVLLAGIGVFVWNRMKIRDYRLQQILLREMVDKRTEEVRNQSRKLEIQNAELEAQKEELAIKNENILRSKEELKVMNEKVHEADEMKLRFFTNISHEFRTPLTLILGPVESLIKKFKNDDEALDYLLTMRRNAGRLQRLLGQIMEFRKVDTGSLKLQAAYGNISDFSENIVKIFKNYVTEKGIKLLFSSNPGSIYSYFDEDKLEKILYNLLSNAIRFTPENGLIELKLSEVMEQNPGPAGSVQSYVQILVSDTGKGIPDEELKHIFDRFYQVKSPFNTAEKGGAGIGLSLTKSLVELHHGEIRAKINSKGGTDFIISLPQDKTHLKAEELLAGDDIVKTGEEHIFTQHYSEEPVKASGLVSSPNESEKPKLLLAEDNIELLDYLKLYFHEEYEVIAVSNGKLALDEVRKSMPNVIISDIIMPEMNGYELCDKVKENHDTMAVPVVLLTAKTGDENYLKGLRHEADAYITKPFSPVILAATIRNLIASRDKMKSKYKREAILEPENIEIESNDDILLRKARKIVEENIGNPEFNVNTLSREVGVSRAALYRKLKALTNQSVNVFVRNIRLKRAAQLLQQNKISVSEVAYMVGYNDVQYFRKCFTREFQMTPTQYVEKFSTEE